MGMRILPRQLSKVQLRLWVRGRNVICPVPYIRVENSREAIAYLAASFYDHPARKMTVIGVTGTDGKTTTSNLIYQILKAAGIKAGLITTVNAANWG